MKEAREREEIMRRLHYVEARIQEGVRTIKRELHESVTYEGRMTRIAFPIVRPVSFGTNADFYDNGDQSGAPYLEKMKWDYTEMIKRLRAEHDE